jgi:hypothetical protein
MASAAVHSRLAARGAGPAEGRCRGVATAGTCAGAAHRAAAHRVTAQGPGRLVGEGTIGQVVDDLEQLRLLGADTVVLDSFNGDPRETYLPQLAWQMLATVSACWDQDAHQ